MHVLIVEDEKKMAELLKKGLEEENHFANLVFDGRDALEMAQATCWVGNIKSHRKRLGR